MDIQATSGSKKFFIALCLLGLFSISIAFYKYVIQMDFTINASSIENVS